MKTRLLTITFLFSILLIAATSLIYYKNNDSILTSNKEEQLLAVNEIEKLVQLGENEKASKKAADLQDSLRNEEVSSSIANTQILLCIICLVFLLLVFSYIYFAILRPFDKMKIYAEQIAQGNFDLPLDYDRSNYFGAFTWAFDNMRLEITKARSCEREAILNNKTVIATLSHDIKTPISSIRAYAEGLEANMDTTTEKRVKYLNVIMKKCDEVSNLTNDLFLHSISDLDKLKVSSEEFEICEFVDYAITEISAEQGDIQFTKPYFKAVVSADKMRLLQLIENLINNSRKYAKTNIDVQLLKNENEVTLHIRDYGTGIPDEDMPFIFDKFYRGRNCNKEQGSGLGLYIVKYIAEQMKCDIRLRNLPDGLEAVLTLPSKTFSS